MKWERGERREEEEALTHGSIKDFKKMCENEHTNIKNKNKNKISKSKNNSAFSASPTPQPN